MPMTQKKHPTPPQILSNEVVAKSRLFTVESLELKFSNDEQRQYERIRGGGRGAVMIVPVTADNELLLVREYCAGTNDYQLGFPKGLIDPGETPQQAEASAGNYLFNLGVLYNVVDGRRDFDFTNGMTFINGDTIKTGKIESLDGLSWFDLSAGKFK